MSTYKHNCTKGPATIDPPNAKALRHCWSVWPEEGSGRPFICTIVQCDQEEANAQLIAEAFNVLAETGMTPRELAERLHEYRELLAATRLTLYAAEGQLSGNVEHFYTNRLKNRRDLQRDEQTGKLNPLAP